MSSRGCSFVKVSIFCGECGKNLASLTFGGGECFGEIWLVASFVVGVCFLEGVEFCVDIAELKVVSLLEGKCFAKGLDEV